MGVRRLMLKVTLISFRYVSNSFNEVPLHTSHPYNIEEVRKAFKTFCLTVIDAAGLFRIELANVMYTDFAFASACILT